MQNVHFRGDDAEDAIEAIEKELELEGFEMVEIEGEDDAIANQQGIRRIVVWEDDGWVSVADDEQADTDWAGVFSSTFGANVITLAGDPEHMNALGEQHGIPKPLLSNRDTEDAYAVLTFRFTGEAEDSQPDMGAFESELGNLAQLLGGGAGGGALDMTSIVNQLTSQMQNLMSGANADTGGEAELHESPTSSKQEGHVGLALEWNCAFRLSGGEVEKGLVVTVSGNGLSLFAPDEMTAEKTSGERFTARAEVVGDDRVFRFPEIELHHQAPEMENAPNLEDVQSILNTLRSAAPFLNPAEAIVRFSGAPAKVGEGEYRVSATLENGSTATSTMQLTVKPALTFPRVPGKLAPNAHDAENYAGRDFAIGWLAFDAWCGTPLALAKELATLLAQEFTVEVVRRGGSRVPVPTLDWTVFEEELTKGANVTLSSGDIFRGTKIELVHQPDGPNLLAGGPTIEERRPPNVVLTWSVPRAKDAAPLAKFAHAALTRAGAEPHVIAGVASAQGQPLGLDLPYESLAGTRLANYDVRQLKIHIRSPGWRVLAPKRVPLTPTDGVSVTELEHALLIASHAADPFAYAAADASGMETAVIDSIGMPEE